MFKSKKKKFAPWPWRIRGLYVALGISLFVNAAVISMVAFVNSPQADYFVAQQALGNMCGRDYSRIMSNIPTTNVGIQFSEQVCQRDAITGQSITTGRVVNGHYVLR
jgi:hypothetical protein